MLQRNPYLAKLKAGYLFPEINKRKTAFLHKNPSAKLISLGIGDTSEPVPESIDDAMIDASAALGTFEGYSGYGPDQGLVELRNAIAHNYYHGKVSIEDIFITDGVKPDIGRMQYLFAKESRVAVQDPAYPVYVDTSLISGKETLSYLTCSPDNHFFPDLEKAERVDLIYFCSPNNPTGAVATYEELSRLVKWARDNGSVILFDSAYSAYIRDPSLPKSIYEIDGANLCAIELGSMSKMAGFSGVRLAWNIVPSELHFDDGTPIKKDWHRIITTFFNGASIISQKGALKAFSKEGLKEIKAQTDFYLENAKMIRSLLISRGYEVYGGDNSPYIWAKFIKTSWETFEELLEKAHIVTTPGSGFGPAGEGFIRFSPFAHREILLEALSRLEKAL